LQTLSAISGHVLGPRFCRRCLHNLFSMREVEGAHVEHVALSESAAEARREIHGKAGDKHVAVVGSRLSVLLFLDDVASNSPVGHGHDRIRRPHHRKPAGIDRAGDVREHGVIALHGSNDGGVLASHGVSRNCARGPCTIGRRAGAHVNICFVGA